MARKFLQVLSLAFEKKKKRSALLKGTINELYAELNRSIGITKPIFEPGRNYIDNEKAEKVSFRLFFMWARF